jgi:hypothetical protein
MSSLRLAAGIVRFKCSRRSLVYRPGRAICEENRLRRHLLGKPQGVRGIGAGRLQACVVPARQSLGNGFSRWRKRSKDGVLFREVVHPAGEPADVSPRKSRWRPISTASRLPMAMKSAGTNTEPRPRPCIVASMLESMDCVFFVMALM